MKQIVLVIRHPRHDPDRSNRLLGTDGLLHHGRSGGGNDADARIPAGSLRRLVPYQGAAGSGGMSLRPASTAFRKLKAEILQTIPDYSGCAAKVSSSQSKMT